MAAAEQQTSHKINFVYKVVNLSDNNGGSPTSSVTTPEPALVFVTAPATLAPSSDIINHRYLDDYNTVRSAFIVGFRVEDEDSKSVSYDADGTPSIQAGKTVCK